jgi:hypothetical protein
MKHVPEYLTPVVATTELLASARKAEGTMFSREERGQWHVRDGHQEERKNRHSLLSAPPDNPTGLANAMY